MQVINLTFMSLLVAIGLYAILLAIPIFPIRATSQTRKALIIYAGISTLFTLNLLAIQQGWVQGIVRNLAVNLILYQPLVQAVFFLHLTHTFLQIENPSKRWWHVATAWLLAPVSLLFLPFELPEAIFGQTTAVDLGAIILVFGWTTFVIAAIRPTFTALSTFEQPLHRNRHTYWVIALIFFVTSDILLFPGGELVLSIVFKMVSAIIIAYVLFTYRLGDVWTILRRTLSYLILIVVGVGFFVVGINAVEYFSTQFTSVHPNFIATIIFLILAGLVSPLFRLIQYVVKFLLTSHNYDPNRLVRDYSKNISNIVDLQRLETTAVDLVSQAMGIPYGALFLVDQTLNNARQLGYEIHSVQSYGKEKVVLGFLPSNSPVIEFWREERHPITQFEIDMSPRFESISLSESAWLDQQKMDVYVPIFSQEKWIGMLAMGPKSSKRRYYDQDLQVLSLMADQTAVALENARLVEDLVRSTDNLTQALQIIERSNVRLREMDELKSSFLGVITHELRTPFANLAFAKQLFERYGLETMSEDQAEVWESLAEGIDRSKKLVDNLVNFASFLGKQGALQCDTVKMCDLLESALLPLRLKANRKGLRIDVDESLGEMPAFTADKSRLTDALHHLIHNAIKFTENGHINVRAWADSDRAYIEVSDTGIGIPADQLDAIWIGFTQMADAIRRGAEGLGLGLAVVKSVVIAHGGDVSVESKLGEGSCFGFWIPLQQSEEVTLNKMPAIQTNESILDRI